MAQKTLLDLARCSVGRVKNVVRVPDSLWKDFGNDRRTGQSNCVSLGGLWLRLDRLVSTDNGLREPVYYTSILGMDVLSMWDSKKGPVQHRSSKTCGCT